MTKKTHLTKRPKINYKIVVNIGFGWAQTNVDVL